MNQNPEYIAKLLFMDFNSTIDPQQKKELTTWINASAQNKLIYNRFKDENYLINDIQEIKKYDKSAAWKKCQETIKGKNIIVPAKSQKIKRFLIISAAAALLIFTFVIGDYISSTNVADINIRYSNQNIQPGKNGAILELENGKSVLLDTLQNGTIYLENGIKAFVENGTLRYDANVNNNVINTVRTEKSRQYQMMLSDGTKVWLNAASTIRFPVTFVGSTRKVQITGEVYFEVAPNKKMPFIVEVQNRMSVEVLGTHFNINAYSDESNINTTLIEGAVAIHYKNKVYQLAPNQQARVTNTNTDVSPKILNHVNVTKEIAWKNGLFNFEGSDIKEIMNQLERWYDITVEYRGEIPNVTFFGEISREENLGDVLEALSGSGIIFNLDQERRLTVRSK
ncbi:MULTISPECIES: FecR family protein [Sphingobacterium]|uniref:FecR family protein n=1 Tax=Sphingobacterium TaxID=28453 RepID=UPI00104CEAEE|nr:MULTISPECIES: FecR family protein [Sphingobacterium]MCW2263103.1 hypothetical protein [Sphingobacterium kitahiroshimense]TCR11913.1 FecR family protein [Sphingobacterium sp. JUb78]